MILFITNPFRIALFETALPVWKLKEAIFSSNLVEYFKSKETLINDKIALEQRLFLSGNMLAINETLTAENESLKDLLGRKNINLNTTLASVLVKPPQIPYDLLIIDVGEDYGLKIGDKVIANANIYIGEVSEVYPHSAKIILYSTPGRKLSIVLGTNSVSAEAVGVGGGNFNIFLPREVEVKEGDIVVIPAINLNVFGIVEKVNFKETDSFQTVLFKSPVNISELRFVEVIINK